MQLDTTTLWLSMLVIGMGYLSDPFLLYLAVRLKERSLPVYNGSCALSRRRCSQP